MNRLIDWLAAPPVARDRQRQACLDRIRALDPSIHAWVQVAPQEVSGDLSAGASAEAEGPLAGIPFGAKDIIETRGLATEYGSPLYKGRIGTEDAAIIRELRSRGAILMGKTQTTAFAYRTPAPTRNPHNVEHTPGGSSSGSAAAVAAGMVPFALGTQTLGSVLRPASFCGVAGFKPTYGLVPMDGILPFAKSLDTLGFFTATAADMAALWESLGHEGRGANPSGSRGEPDKARHTVPNFPLGVPDPHPETEPPMATAFRDAVTRLREAGLSIESIDLGDMLDRLNAASRTVMAREAAAFHADRYRQYASQLGVLADLIREGQAVSDSEYDEASRQIADAQSRIRETYKATPVILVPAATGPAPFSLASTGDARMNAPWTALGTPAISIPMGAFNGLPLGLQLTADRGDDARVLRTAVQISAVLTRSG